MALFSGISHTAYQTRDLASALRFYCDQLGFREAFRLDHPETGKLWIVYLQLAPQQFLELFPVEASEPLEAGNRYLHLCLQTDDLAVTVEALRTRGVEIVREPKRGLDNNLQAWIADPDGNEIEIMQLEPNSPQAQAGTTWARG